MEKREEIALLVLRLALGIFLLVWSLQKIVDSGHAVRIFSFYYKTPISEGAAVTIGAIEAALSLLIVSGAWKRYTYGAGLVLHLTSTLSSWKKFMDPFPQPNDLFVAAIPVLAAFIVLYVLRDRDVLFTLGSASANRLRPSGTGTSEGEREMRARQPTVTIALAIALAAAIGAGHAAAQIKPGDFITPANAAKVKGLVSPGVYYKVVHGMTMKIVPTQRVDWPPPY